MSENENALEPEVLTRWFAERATDHDPAGIAGPYQEPAVMAFLPGAQRVGREAIHALWEKVLSSAPWFEQEAPLPTLLSGDSARTCTPPGDGADAGAQVVRWQPGGNWRRLLDQPEFAPTAH